MIVAISAVSESGDHYLFCETGTPEEILETLKSTTDFAYWYQVDVEPLRGSDTDGLKGLILEAIDKARDEE